MCRNIKNLRSIPGEPNDEEYRLAALQYVRKVSGFRKPSSANEAVFEAAIDQITESTKRLLESLVVRDRTTPAA